MRRLEVLGIILALAVIFGTPAATFGYENFLRSQNPSEVTIIARAPENGNWSPATIKVKLGETVSLRLTSDDVAHGLVIAGHDVEVREIYPGKFTTVEFVANKPGQFPFVCTVLCSPQHEMMIGELVVEGQPEQSQQAEPGKPAKEQLASSEPKTTEPASKLVEPAARPAELVAKVAGPAQEALSAGKTIYESKCMACHGAGGKGGIGPTVAGLAVDKVSDRVRQSGGAMPPFPPAVLSDADLKQLTDYLASLGKGQ